MLSSMNETANSLKIRAILEADLPAVIALDSEMTGTEKAEIGRAHV